MAGEKHGAETQEEPQAPQDDGKRQAKEKQPQVNSKDWEKAVAERDEKIAAHEAQVAEAAKNAETAEQLRGEVAGLKAQDESDRIGFKLQLAGVRNMKVARAVLADHGGDIDVLKRDAADPHAIGVRLHDSVLDAGPLQDPHVLLPVATRLHARDVAVLVVRKRAPERMHHDVVADAPAAALGG